MNFKEIRLIRMLVLILIYLIILFILIFGIVIPSIKQYKSKSKVYHTVQNEYEMIKNEHESFYDKLKSLQHKNRKIIETFEKDWDKNVFLEKANRFFIRTELKLVDNNLSDTKFKIYELDATTQMSSPENFYRFMEALPLMPFAIQADFPISFYSNGDFISGVFRIKVFQEKRRDQKVSISSSENNSSKLTESNR
ncbi:hypothetical protein [Hydrogenimonas thermophila]|uniref:Uncharacterized protein n=1 Tax=Hydrogenimonas thermophila TaxID=223786 RepID=A0A1I5PAG2_9BACT|nr:hypothetical protein [Hydrogenimonas thermophila]WOE69644.1 hypothetical protein RZR91_11120 [Hydrogenimonas thermophila]WOE72158.1 hypothetical protein RZR97_11110 [Hydrogenimonas thermophila]SFP30511.1 hypothetical protein SAMN05216234_11423 [Hydrogenimonas thermophila]